MKLAFYATIVMMCLNLAYTFAYSGAQAKPAKKLLPSNKLTLVGYENGCFDVKRGNTYLLRCA
jgi:hypothetical protein